MANTFNPYPLIGTQLTTGLDALAAVLTPASTIDEFVNAIYNYVQPIYYPVSSPATVPPQIQIEIKSVVYNVINSYNNNPKSASFFYGPKQSYFIDLLLGLKTSNSTPINAINTWLLDIEDNITKDDMPIAAQTPLLLATIQATHVYAYWNTKIATPGTWAPFFQTPAALNYANIPHWLVACVEGALIGAQATPRGLIQPTTEIVGVNIISALIGGLAIGAGKVIFKFVPRVQPANLVTNAPAGGCGCGK